MGLSVKDTVETDTLLVSVFFHWICRLIFKGNLHQETQPADKDGNRYHLQQITSVQYQDGNQPLQYGILTKWFV